MFGKRKRKCHVCGARFMVKKGMVYTAHEKSGFAQAVSGGVTSFDVVDCPECSCQMALGVRMEKTDVKKEEKTLCAIEEASLSVSIDLLNRVKDTLKEAGYDGIEDVQGALDAVIHYLKEPMEE